MCSALEAERSVPEAPRLLEELHAGLSGHFAAEEAESYFGTIVEESPSLAPRIRQLKHEHERMLVALLAMGVLAADPTRATELGRATRLLIGELERHERAESRLIAELLGHSR